MRNVIFFAAPYLLCICVGCCDRENLGLWEAFEWHHNKNTNCNRKERTRFSESDWDRRTKQSTTLASGSCGVLVLSCGVLMCCSTGVAANVQRTFNRSLWRHQNVLVLWRRLFISNEFVTIEYIHVRDLRHCLKSHTSSAGDRCWEKRSGGLARRSDASARSCKTCFARFGQVWRHWNQASVTELSLVFQ